MRVVYVAIFTSGMLCQKQVSSTGTGNYILQYLWDVITCSCPWHLPLISRMFTAFSPSSHQEELILTIATRATVKPSCLKIQYIPRNMHTVFALLCFVVVIHWLIFPYPSGLLHWHWGNLTIAPVPAKQPWWIWINTSCEFIMNDCITTTKQSTTKPCAYFLRYTVTWQLPWHVNNKTQLINRTPIAGNLYFYTSRIKQTTKHFMQKFILKGEYQSWFLISGKENNYSYT